MLLQKIQGQFIAHFKKDNDPNQANERLFYPYTSTVASSESFRVLHEYKNAIVVTGISEEQYQQVKEGKAVENIIQVSMPFVRSSGFLVVDGKLSGFLKHDAPLFITSQDIIVKAVATTQLDPPIG
ncbi:hypothetical protein FisN_23Lu119 [Fistulifera solaris]|uniref:Uncharacterized protein n=1 Tax=Fistulifera solaris TaxID=1519565 RepID=A0A1Z5KK87_FISSO|nr:hypothetical protein FisN_23Lu119 [Fistulifera solaris]|eukprot:GAX26535.1 hypothetical protein FisN_23Lu119 [Fistulifera solaris]